MHQLLILYLVQKYKVKCTASIGFLRVNISLCTMLLLALKMLNVPD